jgi:glycosyltransferase involved in cell wall biosynthesis
MVGRKEGEFVIVVIGRNEGERLRECLQSVLRVSPNVVYADSASTDGSVELARSMGTLVAEVDSSLPLNAARGRNCGFALLREHFPHCRLVQFLDGDCLLAPGWVELAVEFLASHPRAAIACGRRFEADPNASFYNQLADEEWDTPVGRAEACGGDSMVRIDALNEVGGFNPSLMASEEPELAARMRNRGWEVWRLDAPMTEHDAKIFTFEQWWRRTTRSGYGYAQAWQSTKGLSERVNGKLLRSALFWVVGAPVGVVVIALASNRSATLLLLPALYIVQTLRMALRRPALSVHDLRASAMLMLAKVPELIGAARFVLDPQRSPIIEYKSRAVAPSRKSG